MKTRVFLLAGWALLASTSLLHAEVHYPLVIHQPTFEGAIFNPKLLKDQMIGIGNDGGNWTPSISSVMKAEAALPDAIAKSLAQPMDSPNFIKSSIAKNAAYFLKPAPPFWEVPCDFTSIYTDFNFSYGESLDLSKFRRQYIGVTFSGKKFLLINFIYQESPSVGPWKKEWISIDGGVENWFVYYDLVTGTFH